MVKPISSKIAYLPKSLTAFFKSQNVIIAGEIHHMSDKRAVEHMRALSEKSDDPINLIISSPGGHVESGDMLHDMIKFIKPKVRCIGSG